MAVVSYSLTTLASFTGYGGDSNGGNPYAGLIADSAGNLYGTTIDGGASGYGTVFEVKNTGSSSNPAYTSGITTLASFTGYGSGSNGVYPTAGLTADSSGNLYGTTQGGGASGYGTVFEIEDTGSPSNPAYTSGVTTLASFTGSSSGSNGGNPVAGLTADSAGNLFGTTFNGGANGYGTVFEIKNTGSSSNPAYTSGVTTLASFTGSSSGSNGGNPYAGLTADSAGNLFGTTFNGGASGYGTVFEIKNTGSSSNPAYTSGVTTLASFTGSSSGSNPYAGLTADSAGNLYGTTEQGGASGYGTVFEIKNTGSSSNPAYTSGVTTLASFTGSSSGTNGGTPTADLTADSSGNLYGTTEQGGANGYGTVFEIENTGSSSNPAYTSGFTTLASFTGNNSGSNGGYPIAGLTADSAGNLFGTTFNGGANSYGTVFELLPNAPMTTENWISTVGRTDSWNDQAGWSGNEVPDTNTNVVDTDKSTSLVADGTDVAGSIDNSSFIIVSNSLFVSGNIVDNGSIEVGSDAAQNPTDGSLSFGSLVIKADASLLLSGQSTVSGPIDNESQGLNASTSVYEGNGGIQVRGTAKINGDIEGIGKIQIEYLSNLDLAGQSVANNIEIGQGSLTLEHSAGFTGAITGIVPKAPQRYPGDISEAGSTIDLLDVTPDQVKGTGPLATEVDLGNGSTGYVGATSLSLPNGHTVALSGSGGVSPIGSSVADSTMTVTPDGHGGTTVSWLGGLTESLTSGDLNTSTNWSRGFLPGSLDTVTIGDLTGAATTTSIADGALLSVDSLTQTASDTLTVNGELDLGLSPTLNGGNIVIGTGGVLSFLQGGTLDKATVTLDGGTIRDVGNGSSSGGIVQPAGLILGSDLIVNLTNGTGGISDGVAVENDGTITATTPGTNLYISGGNRSSGAQYLYKPSITNASAITTGPGVALNITVYNQGQGDVPAVSNSGTIVAGGGVTIAVNDGTGFNYDSAGVVNSGLIEFGAGSASTISATTFDNAGTLTIDAGASLKVEVGAGQSTSTTQPGNEFTDTGKVTVGTGASLTVDGNYNGADVANIANAGIVKLDGLAGGGSNRLVLAGGTWVLDSANPNDAQGTGQAGFAPNLITIGDDTTVVLAPDISTGQQTGGGFSVTMGARSTLDVTFDPSYPEEGSGAGPAFGNVSGISAGDIIDVAGAVGQEVTLTTDNGMAVLLVTNGFAKEEFAVDQATLGLGVKAVDDGNGGIEVTFVAPGDWSDGVNPGPNDPITIGNADGSAATTTVTGTRTVGPLTQEAGDTLTVTGDLRLLQSPTLLGGTVDLAGTETAGPGRLDLVNGGILDGASVTLGAGNITGDDASAPVSATGYASSAGTATPAGLTLGPNLATDVEGGTISDGYSVTNAGSLTSMGASGGVTIKAGRDASSPNGIATPSLPDGSPLATVSNSGTIVTGANDPLAITLETMTQSNGLIGATAVTNTGSIVAGDGLTISNTSSDGSTTLSELGSQGLQVFNKGAIELGAGSTSTIGGSETGGVLLPTGGTFFNTGTLTLDKGASLTVALDDPGLVGFENQGTVVVGEGASLTVVGTNADVGTIQNAGSVTLDGPSIGLVKLMGGTWTLENFTENNYGVVGANQFEVGDDTHVVVKGAIQNAQVTLGRGSELDLEPQFGPYGAYGPNPLQSLTVTTGSIVDFGGDAGYTATIGTDPQGGQPALLLSNGYQNQVVDLISPAADLGVSAVDDGQGGLKVTFTGAAVASTITNSTPALSATGTQTVSPFAGVQVSDTNAGSPTETLTITQTGTGTLSGAGTATNGVYTLTGTAAQVNTALASVTFTPTPGAPNSTAQTSFALSDKNSLVGTAATTTETVTDTNPAVASTITNSTPALSATGTQAVSPFAGVQVSDTNAGTQSDTLTITQTGTGTLTGAGTATNGVYTLTGTAAQVNAALAGITFTAAPGSANSTAQTSFALSDKNNLVGTAATTTETVTDTNPAVASTITNSTPTLSATGTQTVSPFAGVQVSDTNAGSPTETLTITQTGTGTLSGAGTATNGVYTLTGTAAQVNTALASVTFTPTPGAPNSTAQTSFALSDKNSLVGTAATTTETVTDTNPAVASTITNSTPALSATGTQAVSPFAGVQVSDTNAGTQSDTLTITQTGTGTLSGAGTATNGVYTLTGTAAQVNTALASVTFTPTPGAPNSTAQTSFALSDKNSLVGTAATTTETVTDTNPAVASTITNSTPTTNATGTTAMKPFGGVKVSDTNAGTQSDTLTITQTGNGTLSGAGTATNGVYTLTGTAAQVNTALAGITFTAAGGTPGTTSQTSFALSDKNNLVGTAATTTETVTDTVAAVKSTIANSTPTLSVTGTQAVSPFAGVQVSDTNAGSPTETLTITQTGTGTLSGAGTATNGVYTLTGTAAQVNTALASVTFTPTPGAPNSTAQTSFALSDKNSLVGTAATTTETVSDTNPAVASTITNSTPATNATGTTAMKPFGGVKVSDTNAGTQSDTLTITQTGTGTLTGAGTATNGVYTLTGTAAQVNTALAGITFTAAGGTPGTTSQTSFALSDKNNLVGTAATTTETVTDTVAAVKSTIANSTPTLSVTGTQAVSPFAGVQVSDTNAGTQSDTLTITQTGTGTLSGAGTATNGVYTLTGTAAQVNTALASVTFTPTPGAPNSTAQTSFALSDKNSLVGTAATTTETVTDTNPAVASTITNSTPATNATGTTAMKPFGGVKASDTNAGTQSDTLTITQTGNGTLTGAGTATNGVYTLIGTAAQVNTALAGITFTAAGGTPGTTSQTSFALSDKNNLVGTAATTTETVTDTVAAVKSTIANSTPTLSVTGTQAVSPFAGVQVSDTNAGSPTETLTITQTGTGTLSGAGTATNGVYTLTGTAAQVNTALASVTFTPTPGAPNSTAQTSFALSDKNSLVGTAATTTETVTDTNPAVASTITNSTPATNATGTTAMKPFGGVKASDTNAGTQSDTLTITQTGTGTLTGAGTAINGVYTLTGTAAQVNTALAGITFTAAGGTPGTTSQTSFALSDKNNLVGTAATTTETVTDTVAAVKSTIANSTPTLSVTGTQAVSPFAGVQVSDTNAGSPTETLTITQTGTGTLSGAGTATNGVYTLTGTAAQVNTALASVTFTPTPGAPNSTAQTSFALSDKNSLVGTAATTTETVSDTNPAVASTITNSTPATNATGTTAMKPFGGVKASDTNAGTQSDTLTITQTGTGTLTGAGTATNGVYTLIGTAAQVNAALAAVTFTAAPGSANTTAQTTFALSDKNSLVGTAATTTETVTDTNPAVASTITNSTPTLSATGTQTGSPFARVQVSDANAGTNPTETLTITQTGTGTLSGAGTASNGVYTLTGTAAQVNTALAAVTFTTAPGAPNSTAQTSFALSDKNSLVGTAATTTETVTDTNPAVASTITNSTPATNATGTTAMKPFGGVKVSDTNAGTQSDTLTITQTGTGTLTGAGTASNGVYTLTGTAAQVNTALAAVTFTAAPGSANSTVQTSFALSDKNSLVGTAATTTETVTDTNPAVASTITNSTPTLSVTGVQTVSPFAVVQVSDANAGTNPTETLTITQKGTGTLTGAGTATNGVYTLTGTAAQVNAALAAVTFTTAPGAPNSTVQTSFALSDKNSLVGTAATTTETVSDTNPAVASTITNSTPATNATGTTAMKPFGGVKVSDTNAGTQSDTLTITQTGVGSGNNNTYALTGTAAQVNALLAGTTFTAAGGTAGTTSQTNFALSDANAMVNTAATTSETVTDKVAAANASNATSVLSLALTGSNSTLVGGDGTTVVAGSSTTGHSSVTLGNGNDSVSLGGTNNTIALGNGNDTVSAGSGGDSVILGTGTSTVSFAGTGNTLSVTGGTTTLNGSGAVSIMNLGNALQLTIGSGLQTDTITNFNPSAGSVIDYSSGVSGYSSVNDLLNALLTDAAGTGTSLTLTSSQGSATGSTDFLGVAKNQLTSSNFRIG